MNLLLCNVKDNIIENYEFASMQFLFVESINFYQNSIKKHIIYLSNKNTLKSRNLYLILKGIQ